MEDRRRWRVMRQDDNGRQFVVAELDARADAEALLRRFEALGHKQMYWLEHADED